MKKWLITAASPFPAAIDYYGIESEEDPIDDIYDETIDTLWCNYSYMLDDSWDLDSPDTYDEWENNCVVTTEEVDEFPEDVIMYE